MLTPDGLDGLEVAAGRALGYDPVRSADRRERRTPLRALEDATLSSLRRPPCIVAFSGGRDSSLVLAAAVRAARREALPAPVPVTFVYPEHPSTNEDRWQEIVLGHLDLDGAVRLELGEELDLVGPLAGRELRRHGPLHPPNVISMIPALEVAVGGSLLTGLGGDELLSRRRADILLDALRGRRRPIARDVARLGLAAAPASVRRRRLAQRNLTSRLPWLRPGAQRELARREALEDDGPMSFAAALRRTAADRTLTVTEASVDLLAAGYDVASSSPFLDPGFIDALARAGGRRGFGGRTAAMRAVAGDALPAQLIERRDKAGFTSSFFGAASRCFAERWSGHGLDERLVDPVAVRAAWLAPLPDYRSSMLLQSAWLHDDQVADTAA